MSAEGKAGERNETDEGVCLSLIRPTGTFPQGKVKGVLLDLWFEKCKPPYTQKAFPGAACVPKAKLASAARLMRVM